MVGLDTIKAVPSLGVEGHKVLAGTQNRVILVARRGLG